MYFQGDLEITFMCMDGQQLCSRMMLGLSDFLWKKADKMGEFGNALKFDYTVLRNQSRFIKARNGLNLGIGWWF